MLNYASKMRKLTLKHKIESQEIGGNEVRQLQVLLSEEMGTLTHCQKKMSMGKTIWEGNLPLRDALML